MKICLMTSVYALAENDRNGSFLVESTKYLKAAGVDVEVFAPSYEGLKSHTIQGVPVHRFRYFFKRWENLTHMQGAPNRIRNPLYLFVAFFYIVIGLFQAIRFCRKNKFDILHVHWPFPHGIWGYWAGKLTNTPMVLTFHGAELLLANKFPLVSGSLRHTLKHCRGITCNSSFTASKIAKLTGKEINVIPFGTTIELKPVEKKKEKPVKDLLCAGRMIQRKGITYLLQALPKISEKVDVHLHLVGDGDQRTTLEKQVAEAGLQDQVTFYGIVSNEELSRHYAEADVFVLPAIVDDRGDTEGLGVVLVESLCYGTPVVASHVGGIPDVIKNGETGLLVEQKNPQALADAVIDLLEHPEKAEQLVEQGLKHAQSYFDWQRITGLLLGVYKRALVTQF